MLTKISKILVLCLIISHASVANAGPPPQNPAISTTQLAWHRLDLHPQPPPRHSFLFVLNTVNQTALLFGGGSAAAGELNDLWLTDGRSWLQFHTPHAPSPRRASALAFDEARRQAVLFGGLGNGVRLGDTWIFDGVDWIQQQPLVSPSPRYGASMVYDAQRQVILLFGGQVESSGKFDPAVNEMWQWDGKNWQQLTPAVLPPARWGAGMVYDAAHKVTLLYGGANDGGFWEDTWLWDGAAWKEQSLLRRPGGRANFGLAYDAAREQVILFGGQTSWNTDPTATWAWDGQNWTQLPTLQSPPQELAYGAQLVFLPDLQTVMLYNTFREKEIGPGEELTINERSETWILADLCLRFLPIIRQ